jgi:membrane-bound lytic murein transglycosylase D
LREPSARGLITLLASAAAVLLVSLPGESVALRASEPTGRPGGVPHAILRAHSMYDSGLGSMALAEWDTASDRFHVVWLAAKELEARPGLAQDELSSVRSLAQKAEHLGLQARQTAHLLRHTSVPSEVPASDPSSYAAFESLPTTAPKLPAVEPEMNQNVKKWMDFYAKDGSKVFDRWLTRSRQYLDMVKSILAQEGMPTELAYLILVESGFDLRARSWRHAVGPWQFILGTARLFGLRVDPWIDERCDPERSTVAAARYLRQLYLEFESWPLALAAYNTGEGRVRKALRRQNTRDFWSLRLPRQTREYVPQFMAALHVAREKEKSGFGRDLPGPMPYEEVLVYGPVDLRDIATASGGSIEAVRLLNPAFRRYNSPARKGGTKVRVPAGTAQAYISDLAEEDIKAERLGPRTPFSPSLSPEVPGKHGRNSEEGYGALCKPYGYEFPPVEDELYFTYRVRKGDCLYTIARNFGVSITAIHEFNDIGRRNIIKPGQKLLIPREDVRLSRRPAGRGRTEEIVHVVRSGDTLYSISRSYGVSTKDLARWNSIRNPRLIRPGQKLVIRPN